MERSLDIMAMIQFEKQKDIEHESQLPLNNENTILAEGKRFTFDVIETPVDPLR